MAHVPGGTQPDQWDRLRLPDPGADQGGEFLGEGVGERGPDLVADSGGDRELEVPAGVGAAGAAAQGDGGGGEALVGGVVVGGVQLDEALVEYGGHPADTGQVGQPAVIGFVLALDLAFRLRHEPNLVRGGPVRQRAPAGRPLPW